MPVDDNHTTTHSSLLSLCTNGQNSSGTLNLFSGLCCSAHSGVSQSVNLPPQAPLSDLRAHTCQTPGGKCDRLRKGVLNQAS